MADPTTRIIISAKDQTSAAFSTVNSGLVGLAAKASAASAALSVLGAGALVGSMAAFTKQTLDAQDELFKLSQKTGIAVESLAGLEFAAEQSGVELDKVAKATRTFSLLVAESGDASSESAKKLAQLGLSYKDLKDLSPEKQLLALAEALSKFSKQDQAVAFTSAFGNKMADLIPLLSGGSKGLQDLIDQGKKLNPVTEASAKQAEQFNDQINLLNKSVSALGREFVQDFIPSLTSISNAMVKATQDSGLFAGTLAGIKQAIMVATFGNGSGIVRSVAEIRSEIEKTEETIAKISLSKGKSFFDDIALKRERGRIVQLREELDKATQAIEANNKAGGGGGKKFVIDLEDKSVGLKKVASAQDTLNKAQQESLRVESEYIKLLQIERNAREALLKPYQDSANAATNRLAAMIEENKAIDLSQRKQISLEQAIELTTIARIEEKKAITKDSTAVDAINKELAARKQIVGVIQTTEERTKRLVQTTRSTTDDMSQLWMQAGRNIQTTLANSIFNFFDDGLKGMLKNVISTVGRIASEFAALRLAQSIGLNQMFSGGVGGTGGASGALNAASLGSNLVGAARSGFGLNSVVGGGLSRLGGSVGAFGGGLAGSSAGVFSGVGGAGTAFIGGPGTALGGSGLGAAAGMGASFASLAGPVAALAAGFLGGKMLAGDKKIAGIGGTEAALIGTALGGPIGAVVGGAILKLFGHGPLKFRQQSLQGDVSSGGFNGDLTNVFRAKGGLLVGNKHKSQTEKLSEELQDTLDTTLKSFYKSGNEFAKNLGLSTDLVDTFTTEIQIKSEKGKTITAEAVGTMLTGISNQLAERLLPTVATFKRTGEDSATTLTRLNNEFSALNNGAINLGASLTYARELILGMSIDARTAFIEAAGGAEALAQLTGFFSANFLTDAERLQPVIESISKSFADLGLNADITKEQFKALVQNSGGTEGLTISLLKLAPQWLLARDGVDALNASLEETAKARAIAEREGRARARDQVVNSVNDALAALQKTVDSERTRLTKNYNESLDKVNTQIANVTGNIERLKGLSEALKSTLDAINPVSLSDARSQVSNAISTSQKGGVVDLDALRPALDKLSQSDTSGFSNRNDFLRSQGVSVGLLTKLQGANSKQLTVAERSLKALEDTKTNLETNFEQQINRLDLMVAAAENEAAAISGLSNAVLSLVAALGGFNQAVSNAGGSPIDSGGTIKGNSSISSKDIVNFANAHTPIETYREAIKRGVSSDQIVASGKYTRSEIDKFLKDNKLPSFDVGGIVPKTSLALVHKGERVINPQQNEAIVMLLQELLTAAKGGANYSKSVYDLLRNMTNDGAALNTRTAA